MFEFVPPKTMFRLVVILQFVCQIGILWLTYRYLMAMWDETVPGDIGSYELLSEADKDFIAIGYPNLAKPEPNRKSQDPKS
jgi:hypothetical protein